MLAICRGVQLLNVACGAHSCRISLAGARRHRASFRRAAARPAPIWRTRSGSWDTVLAQLLNERLNGADTCDVNSRHHQAVRHSRRVFAFQPPPRRRHRSHREILPRRLRRRSVARRTSGDREFESLFEVPCGERIKG